MTLRIVLGIFITREDRCLCLWTIVCLHWRTGAIVPRLIVRIVLHYYLYHCQECTRNDLPSSSLKALEFFLRCCSSVSEGRNFLNSLKIAFAWASMWNYACMPVWMAVSLLGWRCVFVMGIWRMVTWCI